MMNGYLWDKPLIPCGVLQSPNAPRLIERFRAVIRSRHYSRRTEKTYWFWIRYFIFHNNKRRPAEMGAREVTAFLSPAR